MAKGRPGKDSKEVLVKSAELIGWALGGLEREIVADPRSARGAERQGGAAAGDDRPPCVVEGERRRRTAYGPPPATAADVGGRPEAHLGNDEEALGRTPQERGD